MEKSTKKKEGQEKRSPKLNIQSELPQLGVLSCTMMRRWRKTTRGRRIREISSQPLPPHIHLQHLKAARDLIGSTTVQSAVVGAMRRELAEAKNKILRGKKTEKNRWSYSDVSVQRIQLCANTINNREQVSSRLKRALREGGGRK